jgi:hypothetical protein
MTKQVKEEVGAMIEQESIFYFNNKRKYKARKRFKRIKLITIAALGTYIVYVVIVLLSK